MLCSSSQLYKSSSETCLFSAVSCCNMWDDSFPGRAIWTSCSILNLLQYNFELALYAIKSLVKTPILKTVFNSLLLFKSNQGKTWLFQVMYSGWNFFLWKSSRILTCSFISMMLMLCKDRVWVLLCLKYALHCMQLHSTLHESTTVFSLMVPAYTPDLNFTEGICIDPTYFKCKSKSCRGVMLMQADLCRIWYIASMFSSCFLCFLPSKRHLLLQRGIEVAPKSGTFTFCACNRFLFPYSVSQYWKTFLK